MMGINIKFFLISLLFLAGCAHTAGDTYVLNEATIEEGFKTGQLIMEDEQSNPDYVSGTTPEFEASPAREVNLDGEMKRHPGRQN